MSINLSTVFGAAASQARAAGVQNNTTVPRLNRSVLTSGVSVDNDLGIFAPGTIDNRSQSDYDQVPASLSNRVPRILGRTITGGVIVDSHRISNTTTSYVIVLSEVDKDSDIYQVDDGFPGEREISWRQGYLADFARNPVGAPEIYRDNDLCRFGGTGYDNDEVRLLQDPSTYDRLDTTTVPTGARSIPADRIKMRIYADYGTGGASGYTGSHLIFPNVGSSTAYDNPADIHPPYQSGEYAELVYAVIQVTNDQDNDIRGLGDWRFHLWNDAWFKPSYTPSQWEPRNLSSRALRDYLTNTRWGVGLDANLIDDVSFDAWEQECRENWIYYFYDRGAPLSVSNPNSIGAPRYLCEGQINTNNSIGENIRRICQSGAARLLWDYDLGKFRVSFSRQATVAERDGMFEFTPHTLIGAINTASSDLTDLSNGAEVTLPDVYGYGRNTTNLLQVSPEYLLPNEPESIDSYRYPLVTNHARAMSLAYMTLHENRIAQTVSLRATHECRDVLVGDYVKLTDPVQGYQQRLFRVIRKTEVTLPSGGLIYNFTLKAYSDVPYLPTAFTNSVIFGPPLGYPVRSDSNILNYNQVNPPGDLRFRAIGVMDEWPSTNKFDSYDFDYPNSGSGDWDTYTVTTDLDGDGSNWLTLYGTSGAGDADEIFLAVNVIDLKSIQSVPVDADDISPDYNRAHITVKPNASSELVDPKYDNPAITQGVTYVYTGLIGNNSKSLSSGWSATVPLVGLPVVNYLANNTWDIEVQFFDDDYYPALASDVLRSVDWIPGGIPAKTTGDINMMSVADIYGPASFFLTGGPITQGNSEVTYFNLGSLAMDQYEFLFQTNVTQGQALHVKAELEIQFISTQFESIQNALTPGTPGPTDNAHRLIPQVLERTRLIKLEFDLPDGHDHPTGVGSISEQFSNMPEFTNRNSLLVMRSGKVTISSVTGGFGSVIIRPKSRMWEYE